MPLARRGIAAASAGLGRDLTWAAQSAHQAEVAVAGSLGAAGALPPTDSRGVPAQWGGTPGAAAHEAKGRAHHGVSPPHVQEYERNVDPTKGKVCVNKLNDVRPATHLRR